MANPSALGAIEWEAESAWGEDVGTFTKRASIVGAVETSGLTQEMIDPDRTKQRLQEGSAYVLGAMGGSFTTRHYLFGHGSTMVGSPTATDDEALLKLVLAGGALSASASTTLTGGTATAPTTTASGTFSAGSLCRIGAHGDGDGDGQMYPVGTHVTTTLTLLADLNGAPVNGAVLYPVYCLSLPESPTTAALTGTRFRLLTANLVYQCHGCYPTAATISGLNAGELPMIEITWGVSWWEYDATSSIFPSATAMTTNNPAPCARGSLHVQTTGVTTRNQRTVRDFQVNLTLGIEPLPSVGGVGQYQRIGGAKRLPSTVGISWTEDADAQTASPVLPGYATAGSNKLVMYTCNATDGKAVGFLFRNVCITNVPVQIAEGNINRFRIEGRAHTGATVTNDLTCSAMVLGLG